MHTFIYQLQNSRDNMSVVLVTFPSAPTVSQEAIEEVSVCCQAVCYDQG